MLFYSVLTEAYPALFCNTYRYYYSAVIEMSVTILLM